MFQRLRHNGIYRGLLDGNRIWIVLGLVAWGVRGAQWALHRQERLVFREVLAPGESLVVTSELGRAATGGARRRRSRSS